MKKRLFASVLAEGLSAFAADQTVTGVLTDRFRRTEAGLHPAEVVSEEGLALERGLQTQEK